MSLFRFFALLFASLSLTVLISCTTQPPDTASAPSSPTPAPSSMAMGGMTHSGKPKININTAILSELDKFEAQLGVPALSNKIQASRPYGKPEELVSKNVVTQAQFDQIKDMVTIEDVVLTGEAKDIDYMTKLGLMKGHMLVAKELLDLQKPNQAEPHIGHPVEEIYADVEDQLAERNVKEFKTTLITLQDLVKAGAKDPAKVNSEFKTSMEAIDRAIATLPPAQRQSPNFVLQVINGLLDTANSEYGAAIANGKITQAIEYQDSRGFVAYANELYSSVTAQVEKQSPETHKGIQQAMAELKQVWPAALPPAAAVKTPTQVSQLIKTVEMDTQKAVKTS
ncbi:helix-hairpin-helix domain-containing protein [Stenomitos frigidus]|uniref:DNA uptake protein n=1 Tax=Stenomitos frigidus ULC18 TaxID=2107698 RepID=A0A2T1DT21_9CYAN|nr:helix-hairpin-helix domain-containing protein [Stenomitos frigidus]PSB23632.1 DNA uptake protein [Stenomitos frigidus ULC18]